jgi:hypothetical protein
MSEATYGATLPIRLQNTRSELLLVHPSLGEHRHILATGSCRRLCHTRRLWSNLPAIVDLNPER